MPEPDEIVLDITNENIAGEWHLTSINGEELNSDNAYFTIELYSESTRFLITENLNSSFENILSGVYSLSENESSQHVISGVYDYSFGQTWNETYSVEHLTEDAMTWKGLVSGDVFVYVK